MIHRVGVHLNYKVFCTLTTKIVRKHYWKSLDSVDHNPIITKGTYTTPIIFKGGMDITEATNLCTNLAVVHPPQLDLAVVGARNDQRHRRVKRCPIRSSIVAFEHMFHNAICLTE